MCQSLNQAIFHFWIAKISQDQFKNFKKIYLDKKKNIKPPNFELLHLQRILKRLPCNFGRRVPSPTCF
jgi:hypothetical protein